MLLMTMTLVSAPTWAQFGPQVVVTPAPKGLAPGAFEVNAAVDPFDYTRNGEPLIAINPKNPRNLVMVYTVSSISNKSLVHGHPGSTPNGYTCGVSVSNDRGHTWKARELKVPLGLIPSTKIPAFRGYNCGELKLAFTPDGVLYIVAVVWDPLVVLAENAPSALGAYKFIAMWSSKDGGMTFSVPWQVGGEDHSKYLVDPATAMDDYLPNAGLPELVIDQSTGTFVRADWDNGKAAKRYEKYGSVISTVQVSHDLGKTWSDPVIVSSPDFPMTRLSYGSMDAKLGVIAAMVPVYASPNPQYTCPCAVLAISRDGGKTFTHKPLPISNHIGLFDYGGKSQIQLPQAYVSLDPERKGRLAAMVLNEDETEMQVLISNDLGATWGPPVRLGLATYPSAPTLRAKMNRPALDFGPGGVVAVMWRQNYPPPITLLLGEHPPGPQDVYAAVSFDGGATFSSPVKANSAPSPWDPTNPSGDDFSSILVDRDVIHIGWGDYTIR
jgi:hypothetical protein